GAAGLGVVQRLGLLLIGVRGGHGGVGTILEAAAGGGRRGRRAQRERRQEQARGQRAERGQMRQARWVGAAASGYVLARQFDRGGMQGWVPQLPMTRNRASCSDDPVSLVRSRVCRSS